MELNYVSSIPDQEAFFQLYETTGWNADGTYTKEQLLRAITNSWFLLAVYQDERLIGFGRIISDGVYQTFIGDLIVHPDFQHKGIGRTILNRLINKCRENGMKWVQLSCARGKMGFYKQFGFKERPADGPGMQLFL